MLMWLFWIFIIFAALNFSYKAQAIVVSYKFGNTAAILCMLGLKFSRHAVFAKELH